MNRSVKVATGWCASVHVLDTAGLSRTKRPTRGDEEPLGLASEVKGLRLRRRCSRGRDAFALWKVPNENNLDPCCLAEFLCITGKTMSVWWTRRRIARGRFLMGEHRHVWH